MASSSTLRTLGLHLGLTCTIQATLSVSIPTLVWNRHRSRERSHGGHDLAYNWQLQNEDFLVLFLHLLLALLYRHTCFIVLHMLRIFTNWRQAPPPPAKRWRLALSRYLLHGSVMDPISQYLQGLPVSAGLPLSSLITLKYNSCLTERGNVFPLPVFRMSWN